jgi:hypothetical protein
LPNTLRIGYASQVNNTDQRQPEESSEVIGPRITTLTKYLTNTSAMDVTLKVGTLAQIKRGMKHLRHLLDTIFRTRILGRRKKKERKI